MTRHQAFKKVLIQYRLESARDMLRVSQLLKENGGSPVSIVNRAYYAVFYATLALLMTADVEPSKHSGVLAKFDELFVRRGIFAKEMSKIIHHAFDMRQAGDYQKIPGDHGRTSRGDFNICRGFRESHWRKTVTKLSDQLFLNMPLADAHYCQQKANFPAINSP